jgi:GNAT superfamily N-acetyltransferase
MFSPPTDHPLGALLARVASGELPPADGAVDVMPAPPGLARAAVVGFTAHHAVAADVPEPWIRARLDADDLGSPMKGGFLDALGREVGGAPGSLDVVLVASALPAGSSTLRRVEPARHPRAERALRYRTDVQVYEREDGAGVLILGRGLAGRWETALEVDPGSAGRGIGRELCIAARALTPNGEPVWAQVAAGNAASLRTVLAAGFVPVGSEVLFVA